MTEEIIKCDRCKKTIDKQLLNLTIFKPQRFICVFSERIGFMEIKHDLCRNCWEELMAWFNAGSTRRDE